MEVVILRNGFAVKTSNIDNAVCGIDGFLSSFSVNLKKYVYLEASNFKSEDKSVIIKVSSGYYEVDAYANYILNPSQAEFDTLKKTFCFDNKFIAADDGQQIIVKIAHVGTPYTNFYSHVTYTFNHVQGQNYLKVSNLRDLDLSVIGTPSAPQISPQGTLATNFYETHIAHISSVTEAYKFQYAYYTILSALRIGMIVNDIFPILQYNPDGSIVIDNITIAIGQITSNWNDNVCFEEYTAASAESYYKHLTAFYQAVYKNQKMIKAANQGKRMMYVIQALPDEAAYLISNEFMIGALKEIAIKGKSEIKESDLELIIKIVLSFNETNQSKIDGFLDDLVSLTNSLASSEEYEEDKFGQVALFKREKVTLFERIFSVLSESTLYKLWHYSPLYKKINASTGNDEKARHRQVFVTAIYTLWISSKYNPYRNGLFNENYIGYVGEDVVGKTFVYSRDPATTVHFNNGIPEIIPHYNHAPLIINNYYYILIGIRRYVDTTSCLFYGFDKIIIYTNEYNNLKETGTNPNNVIKSELNYLRGDGYPYGFYHIYQPIQLINVETKSKFQTPTHSWNDNGDSVRQTYIPAFLLHYMKLKEHDEFVYSIIWKLVNAAYEGIPEGKFTKFIDKANDIIDGVLDILNETIPKSTFDFIADYASSCNGNTEFCRRLKILDTWLQNYAAIKNKVVLTTLQEAAYDVVDEGDSNGWPSEFLIGDGLAAKIFITNIADVDTDGQDNDRKNDILKRIKDRVKREEPSGNITKGEGFSLNFWIPEDGAFHKTAGRLHTDAVILNMIEFGIEANVPDHWIEGIITKAFRIKKIKSEAQVQSELEFASNLLKPLPAPGRNNLLYCFHNIDEQSIFQGLVKQNYIIKYNLFDVLSENGELNNTYYGGSVHTKEIPPDIDMTSYISDAKMEALARKAKATLDSALNYKDEDGNHLRLITETKHNKFISLIERGMNPSSDVLFRMGKRVSNQQIGAIVDVGSTKKLHFMSNEYRSSSMKVTIDGVHQSILHHLNLSENKFDFVFFTKQAAQNGRSIPPETKVNFNE